MCGLVGMAGNLTNTEEKAFHQLLIVDSLRGTDSTGVAVLPRVGEVKIAKELGNPYELIDRKSYDKLFHGTNRCIIGHNRWATVGGVNRGAAHPFDFTTLVGAHNGTLTTKYKFDHASHFATDSEAMYNHIDTHGLKEALGLMGGAWAMTWWDKEKETINFLRNKERPLYVTFNEANTVVFWASESWMLEGVLGRNNIKHPTPVLIGEDNHYSIHIGADAKLEKTKIIQAPSRYVAPVTTPYQGYQNRANGYWEQEAAKTEPAKVTHIGNVVSKKDGVVPATTSLTSRAGYSGTKGATLELLELASDRKGGSYYVCFDSASPSSKVRYYYNKRDVAPHKKVGMTITADIGELMIDAYEGGYYKVQASSVEFENDPVGATIEEDFDPVVDRTYETHTGAMIGFNDWMNQYGDCAWCGSPVQPTMEHALTTEGQCLCSGCLSDTEINDYVKIKKHVQAIA